jgi:hypothetical protein
MQAILDNLKQVSGVARSSDSGEVLEATGKLDAETVCAVAAVTASGLTEIKSLSDFGTLQRWYFVTEQHAYFVSERGPERLIAVGDAVKNPEPTSKTLQGL